jgi:hypothetical protein
MPGRRANLPDEHDVAQAVFDAINLVDTTAIANAILDDRRISACVDHDALQTYDLTDVLDYAVPDAIGKDAIVNSIMMYLEDVKFRIEEQRSRPSPIMDATMLREQILGKCPPHHSLSQ